MEEVYKDRDQFASLVREVAAPDVGRMGIEILSFTIKDVYDNVTYLASLGESAEYTLSRRRLAQIALYRIDEFTQPSISSARPCKLRQSR